MLTGDENIIDIDFAVFWRINDASAFLFNTANPEGLVRGVAESSMREVIGRTPIQPALARCAPRSRADVLKQTQEILDRYQAGVEVTQVQLQKVDPPGRGDRKFPRRPARQHRCRADAERGRVLSQRHRSPRPRRRRPDRGRGRRAPRPPRSRWQPVRRSASTACYKAYQAAKDVTLRRMYLDTMQDVMAHSQPLVVDDKLKGLVPFLPLNVPPPAPAVARAACLLRQRGSQPMNRITHRGQRAAGGPR